MSISLFPVITFYASRETRNEDHYFRRHSCAVSQTLYKTKSFILCYARCPRREVIIVIISVILSKKCICTCVLLRTVSEIELFHCTIHCTLYRRATRHVLTRVAKCTDVDGGIFETVLSHRTLTLKKSIPALETICNISFSSKILGLYSEIALSRKPLGIGHMYIHTF
jgi:hypothetical protein